MTGHPTRPSTLWIPASVLGALSILLGLGFWVASEFAAARPVGTVLAPAISADAEGPCPYVASLKARPESSATAPDSSPKPVAPTSSSNR